MELWNRWLEGVGARTAWLGVGVAVVGVVVVALSQRAHKAPSRWLWAPFALVAAGLGVARAMAQAWLADDAFITFRYARHFAEGLGLVFNPGERVEGYTNFLWAVVLGLGEKVGLAAPYLATALTLGSVVAFVLVATAQLRRPGWLPLAPALLALSLPFIEFATSGLESAPAAVCIGFSALWLRDERRRPRAAWWVLVAGLLRPDHVLFFGPLLLVQWRAGRRALAHWFAAVGSWAVWWCLRWAWYGEFFPNTFHTKSGGGSYWSQGFIYWQDLALTTQLWVWLPLAALVAAVLVLRGQRPGAFGVYAALGATLFGLYVARVGGDFMEYRFGLTSLTLFALWVDVVAARVAQGWARIVAAVVLLMPMGLAPRLLHDGEKLFFLARESSFYPVSRWVPLQDANGAWSLGEALATLPDRGAHAPPLATGIIGMVGYLTRIPIIDVYGLTNPLVAKKPIVTRGRPGHEKVATTDELLAAGAEWAIDPGWPELADFTRFSIGGATVYALRDTPGVRALGWTPRGQTPGAQDSPEWARAFSAAVARMGVSADGQAVLRRFALPPPDLFSGQGPFRVHGACEAGARLHVCAGQDFVCENGLFDTTASCSKLDESWLLPKDTSAVDLRALAGFGRATGAPTMAVAPLDSPGELEAANVKHEGDGFVIAPGPIDRQQPIHGQRGLGLLNSFTQGDAATGQVELRLQVTAGRPVLVSLLVGGGQRCDEVWVEVAGQRVCGQNDETLRTAAFLVTPQTDELTITAVDHSTEGWGHLLVDDVRVWAMDSL